jgi:hypothetical protein
MTFSLGSLKELQIAKRPGIQRAQGVWFEGAIGYRKEHADSRKRGPFYFKKPLQSALLPRRQATHSFKE